MQHLHELLQINCYLIALYIFAILNLDMISGICIQFIDGGTMISLTIFAQRCLSYLMNDMPQEALGDAMQAQAILLQWPTSFYLQATALLCLVLDTDGQESIKAGLALEARKNSMN